MCDALASALAEALRRPAVVLCVGNAMRGDDGFGPAVAARLGLCGAPAPEGASSTPEGGCATLVVDAGVTPENELPRLARRRPRTVLLVDAVHFGGAPGELRLIRPEDLGADDVSTHAGSIEVCARFLEAECGARTVILAAQPASVDFAAEMSPAMEAAADRAAALIAAALKQVIGRRS